MSLTVVTSHRLEDLFAALAEQLERAPLPPLATETIIVPGQGLARWLELRLAERLGIAAGIELPFLGAFLQGLTDDPKRPGEDAFARDVLVFRLWRLFSEHRNSTPDKDGFGAASRYLVDDPDGRKRLQLCSRLAACFDDYQLYRDDVLAAFASGDDLKTLSTHAPWQARLWRALLADAGCEVPAVPGPGGRRGRRQRPVQQQAMLFAELAEEAPAPPVPGCHRLGRLRAHLDDADWCGRHLPARLSVFGTTTMPPAFVHLLHAIARNRPVSLYVPLATPHYIGHLRQRGPTAGDNALLSRFGTESREFADLLLNLEETAGEQAAIERIDLDEATGAGEPADAKQLPHLLGCLQRDVTAAFDRGEQASDRFLLRADDDSLRVHDCHSPQRELEVVRDQIFAAFDEDPTLQARDVLVLVPDIDRYAPYAHAVFGPVQQRLPFHVADRSPARELPLCRSLLAVLELARERLTLADVLYLLENQAVQRRFGLFPTDLPVLRHLCHTAGIRWGLDGESRQRQFGLPPFNDNSWQQGIERLLLGTLTGPCDDLVCGRLPIGDTTDSRAELLARFVTFTRTLFALVASLQHEQRLADWAERIDGLVQELFLADDGDDQEALQMLLRTTVALRRLARTAEHDEPVSLAVLSDWLRDALAQGKGARGFLGGSVTVAAMLPMRAVPVRCLFVCGLDDESFPRKDRPAPFDLIAAAHRPGDRNRRLDDRQLFLDLLLSARDRLHLTFVGHSAKDNAEGAPSVVLTELLEHVDRVCTTAPDAPKASLLVTVLHPLQPWSRHYHEGGDARLFTYARLPDPAAAARSDGEAPWFPAALALSTDDPGPTIALDRLLDFWWHPCRFFLQHTMRVRVRQDDDRDEDAEPFTLDHLTQYQLQHAALLRLQRGDDGPHDALQLARAQGVLPVGAQGHAAFCETDAATRQFLARARRYLGGAARRVDLTLGERSIVGVVSGCRDDEQVYMRTSKLKAKDRLRAWLLHLVVTLQRDQPARPLDRTPQSGDGEPRPWPKTTVVLAGNGTWRYRELPTADARRYLEALVAHYHDGHRRPLPFFERCSFALGEALASQRSVLPDAALRRAAKCFAADGGGGWPGDQADDAIALCMRGRDPFADGPDGEFYRLASTIWLPAIGYLEQVE